MDSTTHPPLAASMARVPNPPRPRPAGRIERAWASVKALGYRSDRPAPGGSSLRSRAAPGEVRDEPADEAGFDTELGNKAAEGAGIGGAIGGSLAAIAAAVAAAGTTIVFPGIGLAFDGPMGAAIAGAGVGAVTGGLVGALIGWGIPEERVRLPVAARGPAGLTAPD